MITVLKLSLFGDPISFYYVLICISSEVINDPVSYAGWSFYTPGRVSQVRYVE